MIYQLVGESYFADTGSKHEEFVQSEAVVLVDRRGDIRGLYDGTAKADMTRAIEVLLAKDNRPAD